MQFNLQNRMLQLDGLMCSLSCGLRFDPVLENYYKQMGQQSVATSLDFNAFLATAGANKIKLEWAKLGLADFIYSSGYDEALPAVLNPAYTVKTCAEGLKCLEPYLGVMPPEAHLQYLKQITTNFGVSYFNDALISSFKQKYPIDEKHIRYLAIQYILSRGLIIARRPVYSRDKTTCTGYEDCYYTSCDYIINTLSRSGITADSPNESMEAREKKRRRLMNVHTGASGVYICDRIRKGLAEMTHSVVKIVPNKLSSGTMTYSMTLPNQPVDLMSGDIKFIPASLMYYFCEGLTERLVHTQMAGITCGNGLIPDYEAKVTVVPEILNKAYSGCSNPDIVAERAMKPVGYSLSRCTYVAYNLEASLLSGTGYAKINPFDIKAIRPIQPAEINADLHELSPDAVLQYFLQHTDFNDNAVCQSLTSEIPEVMYYNTALNDIRTACTRVHISHIFAYMSAHKDKYPRYLSEIKKGSVQVDSHTVQLTGTNSDKVAQIRELMKENLILVKYASSDGTISEIKTTSNPAILAKCLGKDYMLKFESAKDKINALADLLIKKRVTSKQTISDLINKYKIKNISADSLIEPIAAGDISAWAETAINNLPQRDRKPNPDLILFRNCELVKAEKGGYWRNVNIQNITDVAILDK